MEKGFRGSYRLSWPSHEPPRVPDDVEAGVRGLPAAESEGLNARVIEGVQKLIPGEALAGYVMSLGVLVSSAAAPGSPAALALNNPGAPDMLACVLAWLFLGVTIFLRVFGSMDPQAASPTSTIQWPVVIFSALAFCALVYASGQQFWLHPHFAYQQQFGTAAATVLGIIVPVLYGFMAVRAQRPAVGAGGG
jgi:hypothetical protein